MGIFEYNGSSILAMGGKDCVAIVSDMRLGENQFKTVSNNFDKISKIGDRVYMGVSGLATDIQTFSKEVIFNAKLAEIREEAQWDAKTVAHTVASMLYSKRFNPYFIMPIVAGLNEDKSVTIANYDSIGSETQTDDFAACGTSSDTLTGLCEQFWYPNMNVNQLKETISQCFLSGLDRDCLSGWGAKLYIITPENVTVETLETRMD